MEALLFITGVISPSYEEYPSTSLEYVKAALEWQKPFDTVRVTINSPGGYVTEGMAIYDYLRSLPDCTIITEALGQCSSIATAIFLAGSERRIHAHTEFLIHLPAGGAIGTADQMQQYVNDLKRDQQNLINLYVERAGVEEAAIAELMAKETVLTPEQAQELGFATLVVQPVTALARPSTALTVTSQPQPEVPAPSTMSKIAAMASAFAASILALGKTPAKALAVTVVGDDATPLTIDTGDRDAYEVGDKVYTDEAMTTAAADASYALTDGNTIVVVEGAISSFATTEAADSTASTASDAESPVMQQLLEGLNGLTNIVKQQGQAIQAIQRGQSATAQRVNTIAAATGSTAVVETDDVPTSGTASKEAPQDPHQMAADRRAARAQKRIGTRQ